MKLEAYRAAIAARNFEIGLFWQRSNYFLVLNTAIAAGFFSQQHALLRSAIAVLGLITCVLWLAVNLGGKFWQSRWEHRVRAAEDQLDAKLKLFSASWETVQQDVRKSLEFRPRGPLKRGYGRLVLLKPSVSAMMTLLSVAFIGFWLVALYVSVRYPSLGLQRGAG